MTSNVAPERTLGSIAQGSPPSWRASSPSHRSWGPRVWHACGIGRRQHPGPVTVAERAAARRRRPRPAHHVCRPCQLRARGGLPTMNAMEDPS
jgi:hypothetical protein